MHYVNWLKWRIPTNSIFAFTIICNIFSWRYSVSWLPTHPFIVPQQTLNYNAHLIHRSLDEHSRNFRRYLLSPTVAPRLISTGIELRQKSLKLEIDVLSREDVRIILLPRLGSVGRSVGWSVGSSASAFACYTWPRIKFKISLKISKVGLTAIRAAPRAHLYPSLFKPPKPPREYW